MTALETTEAEAKLERGDKDLDDEWIFVPVRGMVKFNYPGGNLYHQCPSFENDDWKWARFNEEGWYCPQCSRKPSQYVNDLLLLAGIHG